MHADHRAGHQLQREEAALLDPAGQLDVEREVAAKAELIVALGIAGAHAWKNSRNYDRNEDYGLDPLTRKYIEEGYKTGDRGGFDRH